MRRSSISSNNWCVAALKQLVLGTCLPLSRDRWSLSCMDSLDDNVRRPAKAAHSAHSTRTHTWIYCDTVSSQCAAGTRPYYTFMSTQAKSSQYYLLYAPQPAPEPRGTLDQTRTCWNRAPAPLCSSGCLPAKVAQTHPPYAKHSLAQIAISTKIHTAVQYVSISS